MTEIALGGYGGRYVALVDECFYPTLSESAWRACVQGSPENRRVYAVRQVFRNGVREDYRMHRVVWELAHGPIRRRSPRRRLGNA